MQPGSRGAWSLVAAALLIAFFLARLLHVADSTSLTVDEPHYIGTALYLWETGDYHFARSLRQHPPLAYHLAGLPLLAFSWSDLPAEPYLGPELLRRDEPGPRWVRLASRLPFALLGGWGALLCFLWARELAGDRAGWIALWLYSFSPLVLAHSALAHSDLPVSIFFLQTLYAFWRHCRRPSPARLLVVGLSLGLTLASKLSGVLLPVALLPLWILEARRRGPGRVAAELVGVGLLAAGVLWAAYGGSLALAEGSAAGGRPLPGYLQAFLWDVEANRQGRQIYFFGSLVDPPWYVLPVAFLLKVPLATLVLVVSALALALRRPAAAALGWWLPIGVYLLAACLLLEVPLGLRYLLPIFPPLFVGVGAQLGGLRGRLPRAAIGAALALLAVGSLRVHPHYLAHFNLLAGGPDGGARYLLDSNLDWGQGLPALARSLQEAEPAPTWIAYFGPEPPRRYGIRARPLPGCRPVSGRVAISLNVLHGLYRPGGFGSPPEGCYAWLRELRPSARPSHSIHVYDVPPATAPGPAR